MDLDPTSCSLDWPQSFGISIVPASYPLTVMSTNSDNKLFEFAREVDQATGTACKQCSVGDVWLVALTFCVCPNEKVFKMVLAFSGHVVQVNHYCELRPDSELAKIKVGQCWTYCFHSEEQFQ